MAQIATSTPVPDSELPIGSVIAGKWKLEEVLGSGGMAVVYGATHRNGSRVAIKVMRHGAARDDELVGRFTKEGHVGNLVDHPGVVKTLDDGVLGDGIPYLVMERLDGESLEQRVARVGALPLEEALVVVDAVLDALAAAHAAGLVHRDIKPGNVFLARAGGVKLLDFGIARERIFGGQKETIAGLVFGTPAFMPPEQARGRWDDVGPRSDLWAVAATLFVAATGRLLRDGGTPTEELLAALLPLGSMRDRAPALPVRLCDFLDRGLAHDPGSRFGSALEMQAALRAASPLPPGARLPSPVVSVYRTAAPLVIPTHSLRPRALWGGGACALVLIGLLFYAVRGGDDPVPRVSLPALPAAVTSPPAGPTNVAIPLPTVPVPEVAFSTLPPPPPPMERPPRAEPRPPVTARPSANAPPKRTFDPLVGRF
jgi:serine/threonine protein kinase